MQVDADSIAKENFGGYVVLFDSPDKNGNIVTKSSVNLDRFDKMKANGDIVDYKVDNIGVMAFVEYDRLENYI